MTCMRISALLERKRMNSKDFDYQRIVQGYRDRPFLHRQVIDRFRKEVTDKKFANGLDAGCGAGLSSKALREICSHVTGADISAKMIEAAKEVCADRQGYDFIVSKAEEIPAVAGGYDIVTAAGVIQWVERGVFLRNLKKIMNEHGYVIIYDFGISDKMKGSRSEKYFSWWHHAYLEEFPRPSRNEHIWTKDDVRPYGFSMLRQVSHEMEYEFDMEAFIRFMMIQSNVNAKIEGEGRSTEEVQKWFEQSLAPVFQEEKKVFIFSGYSWYIKAL